jgi:tricorn protease
MHTLSPIYRTALPRRRSDGLPHRPARRLPHRLPGSGSGSGSRYLALLLTLLLWCAASEPQAAAWLRFPALSGDTLIFTAEGDLWQSSAQGGRATRLTSHPAEESRAAISPDGRWLAFSAAYDGPVEAYVMPLAGGQPRRISFENSLARVVGWTPQGEVLYSAQHRLGPNAQRVISRVNPQTLARTVLPLAEADEAVMDSNGEAVFFTRMGLALTNDNAKGYRGGAAAQLWRYDLKPGKEALRLTQGFAGSERGPMWWQGRLYFISERDGSHNLWSMLPDAGDLRQHTHHTGWDIRSASLNAGRIVYQLGADLHLFSIASGQDQLLNIELASDYDQQRPRLIKNPLKYFSHASLAPNGERLAVTARGHLALLGTGGLRRIEIPLPPGSRARDAVLAPDGKWLYLIGDASGENEIWRFAADGSGSGLQLTHSVAGQGIHRSGLLLSPDGKRLAHWSKAGQLWLIDLSGIGLAGSGHETIPDKIQDKIQEPIDTSSQGAVYTDLVWSPDSRLLAIGRHHQSNERTQLAIYDSVQKQLHWVTSAKYSSHSASFTPDGRWLYFVSERHFQSSVPAPWDDRNFGPHFDNRSRIYALALQPGRFPFQAKTELDPASPSAPDPAPATAAAEKAGSQGNAKANATGSVQWQGLNERLYEVPLPPGNYRQLQTDGKRLYFLERERDKSLLKTLAIEDGPHPAELFAPDVRQFELSGNGKKLYFQKAAPDGAGEMWIVDAGPKAPQDLTKFQLGAGHWQFSVTPLDEWQQIFLDAWRLQRDYLFDRHLRGVDWLAMKRKYGALLPRVHDRRELNDLLGMMNGELSTLHSQIIPGEVRQADDGSIPSFPGGLFEREAGGCRLTHIYQSEAELPLARAPLAQPGVEMQVGDLITAVNGKPCSAVDDISLLFSNQAGQQVWLRYLRGKEARSAVITPVALEQNLRLRYGDWEEGLRARVEQQSQGKIGYLHLRAMGPADIATFAREFYAHIDKDGLIIDVRRNNGGNIDSWIIEKLLRRVWMLWQPRNGPVETNMQQTFRGHLAVLADELTYSDGETFTAAIKALKLGTVVGKRTAGAGVWLGDANVLIDKGRARAAEDAVYSVPGAKWLVEGVGVEPDIEVDNLPHASFMGQDSQLDRALSLLQDKIKAEPLHPLRTGVIDPVGAHK